VYVLRNAPRLLHGTYCSYKQGNNVYLSWRFFRFDGSNQKGVWMRKKLMILLVYQLKYTTLGYLLFTPNEFTFVQGYMGTSMLRHLVTRYNVHGCQSQAQKMTGSTQFLAWAHEQNTNQKNGRLFVGECSCCPPIPPSKQTLNKSQEVESSHIVSLFLKLKK
jgi:hypothetical protein